MQRILLVLAGILVLTACSPSASNFQNNQQSSLSTVASTRQCTFDPKIYKFTESFLQKALQTQHVYMISGICEMPDNTRWISVWFGNSADFYRNNTMPVFVHVDTKGNVLKILEGYTQMNGDIDNCSLIEMIGSRLIVTCKTKVMAVNTNTDERLMLREYEYGDSMDSPMKEIKKNSNPCDSEGCFSYQ